MSSRRSPGLLQAGLLLVVVAIGVAAYLVIDRGGGRAAAAGGRTVTVSQGTVTATVSASGTITPSATAALDFGASGDVTAIYVKAGQRVRKGQWLAHIDPSAALVAVQQAQVQLTAAQTALTDAEDAGSDDATIAADEAALAAATQSLKNANAQRAGTYLTAPFAGTVLDVNGVVREPSSFRISSAAAASSSASTTTTSSSSAFLDLADLAHLELRADFAEADVAQLRGGQTAQVVLNSATGTTYAGRIVEIDATATTSNNVVEYGVTVALTNAPKNLRPGQTANVTVIVGSRANVLSVPTAAVTNGVNGKTVTVLRNGAQTAVPVTVGLAGDSADEITAGLNAGDQVVIPIQTTSSSTGFPAGGFPGGGGGLGGRRGGGGTG